MTLLLRRWSTCYSRFYQHGQNYRQYHRWSWLRNNASFVQGYLIRSPYRQYGNGSQKIVVKYHYADGRPSVTVEGKEGQDLMHLAHENDIDLEGACEGSLACSTCHVILPAEYYERLPEPTDEENDMLDLAFGLVETSRLGCQVRLKPELDGISVTIPSATRNMAVDGYKPKPH